ncbi:MAG: hypothetical protein K2O09_06730 [Treponemataceae bacterium]|nr:hypothetical protein [Treponemataceae bacterium]
MKKLTKIAATLAALLLALALAGCDNDEEPTEENGQADWSGFAMADSVDKLDFKVGKYELKEMQYADMGTYTGCYDIEILSAEMVTVKDKFDITKFNNKTDYEKRKAWYESKGDFDDIMTTDDNTLTITMTYSDDPYSTSISSFKKDFFPEEDIYADYSETYTDKKCGSKNGVIQMSYTTTYTASAADGGQTQTYHCIVTLTPQK